MAFITSSLSGGYTQPGNDPSLAWNDEMRQRAALINRLKAGEQIDGWRYDPGGSGRTAGDSELDWSTPEGAWNGNEFYFAGSGAKQRNEGIGTFLKDAGKLAAVMGTAYLGGTALAGMGGAGGAAAAAAAPVTDAATAAFLEANMGALAPTVSGGFAPASALGAGGLASGSAAAGLAGAAAPAAAAGGWLSTPGMLPMLGSLGGGLVSAFGANSAAKAQTNAANNALALQKEQFDKQLELQAPFREAGLKGQNRLMELLGLAGDPNAQGYGSAMRDFGMQDFQTDPGYQFRQQQGQQALERSASARGGLLGGAAMKDAMRFNQGLASDEYTNAFNRFQTNRSNKLNPLQSLSGMAQTSTNNLQQASSNYANSAGEAMMQAGNARASGYAGTANALNSAIGQGLNMYQQNQWMNRRYPQPGVPG